MIEQDLRIRTERDDDYDSILTLTYESFETLRFPGRKRIDEHYLVSLLRGKSSVIKELCLVAELSGKIVGHILYVNTSVARPDGAALPVITFGPLSVLPEYQRQGVGRALVSKSFDVARKLGYGAVVITGVPDYYPKLGFVRAREFGLTLPDGSAGDHFMAFELIKGYLSTGGRGGVWREDSVPEYLACGAAGEDFTKFHEAFVEKFRPKRVSAYFEND